MVHSGVGVVGGGGVCANNATLAPTVMDRTNSERLIPDPRSPFGLGPDSLGLLSSGFYDTRTGIVEPAAGALEPLVQRRGDFSRQRAEPRPLRLRIPDFLFSGAPARLVGIGALAAGHRVGGEALAPALREQFSRRELRRRSRRLGNQLLD